MRIAGIQMHVAEEKRDNLKNALRLIARAADEGAELAVLPEMFICPYNNESFVKNAEIADGETLAAIAACAREHGIFVVAGSVTEREDDRIYNASFVFDGAGRRVARHRKAHLFDIDVKGGQRFFESATFTAGDEATVFDAGECRVGLCICFDMRFPELSRIMVDMGAKLIIVPAAFNMTTGPAHWEVMLRSRAIDNSAFVLGIAPARDESAGYVSYGNTMLCSPWGEVLFRAGTEECVNTAEIDLAYVDRVRSELPLLSARRRDIYSRYGL